MARYPEHPFLLDNSEKTVSAPASLEILPNKSFLRESPKIFQLGQVE